MAPCNFNYSSSGASPIESSAQSTSNLTPQNETVQDTSRQKDMLDIYRKLFKVPAKPKRQPTENKDFLL
jgi:hypothetical protein